MRLLLEWWLFWWRFSCDVVELGRFLGVLGGCGKVWGEKSKPPRATSAHGAPWFVLVFLGLPFLRGLVLAGGLFSFSGFFFAAGGFCCLELEDYCGCGFVEGVGGPVVD